MRNKSTLLYLAILLILGLTFTSAFAASPATSLAKKTAGPAPKATEKAHIQDEDKSKDKDKDKDKEKDKEKEKEKSKTPPGLRNKKPTHTPKAEDKRPKTLHLRGTIESASADSLELKTGSQSYTIAITADTQIHIPTGLDLASAAGAQASVKAIENPADTYTAVQIHVIPGKPATVHHVGTVSADNRAADGTGTLEITWKDGATSTVTITAETVYLPTGADSTTLVGKRVTVIYPRNLIGDSITAKGIVIH